MITIQNMLHVDIFFATIASVHIVPQQPPEFSRVYLGMQVTNVNYKFIRLIAVKRFH